MLFIFLSWFYNVKCLFCFQVVEGPCDSVVTPDGAALSAFQYFENVRNFLVAVEELGLPTFEFCDLEQVGFVVSATSKGKFEEWNLST